MCIRDRGVTLLPYLGHLKHHISCCELSSHRQIAKIQTFHHQIFSKSAVLHVCASLIKFLHPVIGQKADLPVPVSCVGIPLNPLSFYKMRGRHCMLFHASSLTDTNRSYNPCLIQLLDVYKRQVQGPA